MHLTTQIRSVLMKEYVGVVFSCVRMVNVDVIRYVRLGMTTHEKRTYLQCSGFCGADNLLLYKLYDHTDDLRSRRER